MTWLRAVLVVAMLMGANEASANPHAARTQADTTRQAPLVEMLEAPVTLEMPSFGVALADHAVEDSIELRMGALAPSNLEIRLDLHPATSVYISADLSSELPRLDALDNDTYFVVGVEFHLTSRLRLFVEDFQPASMVVGDPEELEIEPPPLRSWDGHQIGIGFRWQPTERTRIEAGAVLAVLSQTDRESSTGVRASVAFSF